MEDDSMLPFASLSSSPPRPSNNNSGTQSLSRPRSSLPPLSARAQDRLNQRRTALFKQPPTIAAALASSSSRSRLPPQQQQQQQHRRGLPPSSSSPPSSPSSFSARPMLPFSSPTPGAGAGPSRLYTPANQADDELATAAPLKLSPSTMRVHAKIREQCDALRRKLRAERVERSRGQQQKKKVLVQRGGAMQLDDDDDADQEAEWEREDDELIRRTMLLEHRKYMQAGLSTCPNSDWDLDPDDAARLEEEMMLEQQEREWEEEALMMEMEAEACGSQQVEMKNDDDDEMQMNA
ncbi:hypothetical protein CF327_g4638 [Tilletia walkeri]|uniref:Uncharacterized protein n=1 Tax=Tilletia walkeri TaxID=117179 RepID=A0A8X7T4R8_9BASI|nr:hypothetical protein CF327_g4638 [Tilletia walkeri]KAE8268424.1 hypothetical protein A4X09_0g3914 [Tilletia walkeri]